MSEPTWIAILCSILTGVLTRTFTWWQARQQIENKTAPRIRREAKEDLEPLLREMSAVLRESLATQRAGMEAMAEIIKSLRERPQ